MHATEGPFTRVSAGTIVLGDLRSLDECPVGLEPAAVVVSRCVSNPTEGVYTLDAGVKALAEGCAGLTAIYLRGCSEMTDAGVQALAKACPGINIKR